MRIAIDIPAVYLITQGRAEPANFSEKEAEIIGIVSAAVDLEVPLVQVREKRLPARLLCALTEAVVATARGSRTKILVNDRADIALACGADGVHLTSTSMPAAVIRTSFPPEFIIGVSTHTLEEVEAAAGEGADFALFGPVFATPGKDTPQGLDKLKHVCEADASFPVLAIGGIDANNVLSAIDAGAAGIAAIRALNDRDARDGLIKKLRT